MKKKGAARRGRNTFSRPQRVGGIYQGTRDCGLVGPEGKNVASTEKRPTMGHREATKLSEQRKGLASRDEGTKRTGARGKGAAEGNTKMVGGDGQFQKGECRG